MRQHTARLFTPGVVATPTTNAAAARTTMVLMMDMMLQGDELQQFSGRAGVIEKLLFP